MSLKLVILIVTFVFLFMFTAFKEFIMNENLVNFVKEIVLKKFNTSFCNPLTDDIMSKL